MSAQLLDGKPPAQAILDALKPKVQQLNPKLVIVQVGDDPASDSYIQRKLEACKAIGMRNEHKKLSSDTSFDAMLELIKSLNADTDVTGFIVQLPLPKQLQEKLPLLIRE